jgi:glycosyltransferase involved in cell wall biosynthesis
MHKTLSIVIPTKNEEKFLPQLLTSILNQQDCKIGHIPIFVADNDSTDGTLSVIADFQSKGLNITVVSGGLPAHARNIGARSCNTEYVLFLDADTTIRDDLITQCNNAIRSQKKPCYAIFAHDKNREFPFELMWFGYNFFLKHRWIGNAVGGFGVCIERTRFLEIGGFNEVLSTHEDVEIGRRFTHNEVGVVDSTVYIDPRRFRRDGFWRIFGMYTYVFFTSLVTKKYNSNANKDYFKKDFS